MHPVVIKYVQLVCVAFLFDNISCDNLSLEASRDDFWLNREASCMAACMEKNLTAVSIYLFQDKLQLNLNVFHVLWLNEWNWLALGADRLSWKMSSNKTHIKFNRNY